MKLAEALMLRSDLQKKLYSLQNRLNNNVLIQEGDEPSESAEALLAQIFEIQKRLHALILKIHQTNAAVIFDGGRALLAVLNERDELMACHKVISTKL